MDAPSISVLVPCYNTSRYLRQMVASIMAQTMPRFELILLNDGSTDETASLLEEFSRRDPRIRVRSRENKGLVETRNELVAMAHSEFIAWLDSDDEMAPRRLEWQLDAMHQQPQLAWVGGACVWTDPDGRPIWNHAFPEDHDTICKGMEQEISCYFGSTLMRKKIVEQVGGFRHPFKIAEDFDLCLRMSEVGRVGNLPESLLYYRQHLTSTVNSERPKSYIYSQLVRELARERRETGSDRLQRGELIALDFGSLPTARQNRVDTHRKWAWWALASGHRSTARRYALHAMREAPLDRESWKLMACALRGH